MKCAILCIMVALGSHLALPINAECGDNATDWEVLEDFQLLLAPVATMSEVSDVDQCTDECKEGGFTCLSFEYSATEEKCNFNDKRREHVTDEEQTQQTGVMFYELKCADNPDLDDSSEENEFVKFLSDEPAYAAMAGMGIFIIILAIFAVCAICLLSHDRRKSEGIDDFMDKA